MAGTAQTIQQAMSLIDEEIDAVLLDMKLLEGFTDRFADFLKQQGIPFPFMSGYTRPLAPRFQDTPYSSNPSAPAN